MIKLKLYKNKEKDIIGFEVLGHSGYSQQGKDIVCAAVSSVVWTTINGLINVIGIDCIVDQEDGFVRCKIPNLDEKLRNKANILLISMELFYNDLLKQYSKYLMKTEVLIDV